MEAVVITWSLSTRRTEARASRRCSYQPPAQGSKVPIALHPSRWDLGEVDVLQALAHAMIHAVLGAEVGHRPPFDELAARIGLEGPPTSTAAGKKFRRKIQQLRAELPAFPLGAIVPGERRQKQRTRLRLWQCCCAPPVKVRVSRDDFDATCNACECAFMLKRTKEFSDHR
jgi:hypothetical protein